MNTLKHKVSLGLVALIVAVSAQAQGGAGVTAGDTTGAGAHHGHPPSETDRAKFAAKFKERMEKHQTALHDKLKLNSSQEPAWKSFVDSVAPTAMPMPMPFDRKAFEGLNAPARLEKMLDRLKEHEAKMQSHLTALKSLYAVLTPEQQKIMDDDLHHMMARFQGIHERRSHGAEHGAEHTQK